MDNKKKDKLAVIILTTLIALATSITACICETTQSVNTDINVGQRIVQVI